MRVDLSWAAKTLLDLLFPSGQFCLLCREEQAEQGGLCACCLTQLGQRPSGSLSCHRCGTFFLSGSGNNLCRQCRRETPPFALARAVGPYTGKLKQAVHLYKYGRRRIIGAGLAELMAADVEREAGFQPLEVIVPVPLHKSQERARGFNQAELLARLIGKSLGVALRPDALARIFPTRSQTRLPLVERRGNVAGAFRVQDPALIRGRHVLLVDDVYTTGSTAAECATTLLQAGARRVVVITAATGLDKTDGKTA